VLSSVTSQNPKVGEERVQQFEREHGIHLPESYRGFLLENNGGHPEPDVFPIQGFESNPFGVLQIFFGLSAVAKTSDLDWVLSDISPFVPAGILPIGCTEGGDFVCMDLRRRPHPIVYWDRRPFWGTDIWNEADLYPIAKDFQQFLTLIHRRIF
jgi:hypothetical protein